MRAKRLLGVMLTVLLPVHEGFGQSPPMPGRLVDIGGRRLHLDCRGQGQPTVIVENGGGAFSIDWALVQDSVASFARICTYDRASHAWSDPGPLRNLPEEVVADFQMLVRSAALEPPFVLVGQSIGGIYVREYQRRFPELVAGLVLVDPTHDEGLAYIIEGKPKPITQVTREEMGAFMRDFLARPQSPPPPPTKVGAPFDKLPSQLQVARLWAQAQRVADWDPHRTPYIGESSRQLFLALKTHRLAKPYPLGRLPLVVLTDGPNPQKSELVSLSTAGKLVVAPNSCHEVHVCTPKLVIQAIREVVQTARR